MTRKSQEDYINLLEKSVRVKEYGEIKEARVAIGRYILDILNKIKSYFNLNHTSYTDHAHANNADYTNIYTNIDAHANNEDYTNIDVAAELVRRVVPHGQYCYEGRRREDSYRLCPYWGFSILHENQNNGFCTLLGRGDWSDDYNLGLLWDQIKECGINMEELEDPFSYQENMPEEESK